MICLEGYKKKIASTGKYLCLENGEWIGEETVCDRKNCGSPHEVSKIRQVNNMFFFLLINSLVVLKV